MPSRKRKHGSPADPTVAGHLAAVDNNLLHVQAYEADIRCSSTLARSLEVNGLHVGQALVNRTTLNTEIWVDRCVSPSS